MNRIQKFFSNEDGLRKARLGALGAIVLVVVLEIIFYYHMLAGK